MAPAWVLLDRFVKPSAFEDKESEDEGESTGCPRKYILPRLRQEVPAGMRDVKPYPQVADPPCVSLFSMAMPWKAIRVVKRVYVQCADKNLVLFYAGAGDPGSCSHGCYLIYDAIDRSLTPVHTFPYHVPGIVMLGGAAVLRHTGGGDGAYVLAELLRPFDGDLPDATLLMWLSRSPATPGDPPGQWIKEDVRLPPEVCTGTEPFFSDLEFSSGESRLCWADLFNGILFCDLATLRTPRFRFIPLPKGCSFDVGEYGRPRMDEFRTIGCVGGVIKFIDMEVYTKDGAPIDEVKLTTWTLAPDLSEWKKGPACSVGDIWASEKFIAMGMPRLRPMCPVLSMVDKDVVCVVMTDVEVEEKNVRNFDDAGRTLKIKAQYVLDIDVRRKQVLSITQRGIESMVDPVPYLIACEFSAYLELSKDRQTTVEGCESEESTKRMKLK
ncbi:uncharacterized protein LOC102706732 [Oryza brachyantha]|uniref:DUF1618 domain-containing protein n=1 Tax=Oryza brachyantha TaxID=4533 RepID=J3LLZ6_ORYBR|nr:uncharacterized protein LOC102706732 [Oryza brachyantha]